MAIERVVDTSAHEEDPEEQKIEISLRPTTFSEYIGQELYIILADEEVEAWSHAFFDEVVTYYETAPDYANLSDTVIDGGPGAEIQIPWQLAENLK